MVKVLTTPWKYFQLQLKRGLFQVISCIQFSYAIYDKNIAYSVGQTRASDRSMACCINSD